jgi:hypothetical protein
MYTYDENRYIIGKELDGRAYVRDHESKSYARISKIWDRSYKPW